MDAQAPEKPEQKQPAEKFIRTYASDMEIAKKGGTPDLSPYDKRESVIQPVAGTQEVPVAVPDFARPIKPVPNEFLKKQMEPTQEKPAPTPLVDVIAQKVPSDAVEVAAPLHTYADDFSSRVKEQQASTFSILAAEQDTGKGTTREALRSNHTLGYLIGGTVLFLLGIGGAFLGYVRYQSAHAPVQPTPTVKAPLFYDEQKEVIGEGAVLKSSIAEAAFEALLPNKVRLIYSSSSTTTRMSLFAAAQIMAPQSVLRNIVGDGSMVGSVNSDGGPTPFFVLSVLSYNDTFAGMLSWESQMLSDLSAFYPAYPAPQIIEPLPPLVPTTTATTTKKGPAVKKTAPPATTTPPAAPLPVPTPTRVPQFYDQVVSNIDARVYRDTQGRVLIIYGFWNQNTLVIARDETSFSEILRRLRTTRTQP